MTKLGKNMRHALDFAKRVKAWHTFNTKERATVQAIKRLEIKGLVKTNKFNQFKIN